MQLAFLEPLIGRPGPWATVYAAPADNDEAGTKRRELAVRDVSRTLVEDGADAATVRAVHDALSSGSPADYPSGRAVFATEGEVVLSHRLSRPPQRQIVCWATLPRLTPLLELSGQDPVCLVAYVDRTGADFEVRGAAGPEDAGQVEGRQWPVHRAATGDLSAPHFQVRVENTWEHNAGEIAEALTGTFLDSGADLVVLVGDPRERRAVHDRLPDAVRDVTSETEHGGRAQGSESPALEQDIARAARDHARRGVARALDRFHAGRGGGEGRPEAVEGVPAVVEAAREHQIDTLLICPDGPDLGRDTWVGAEPDQLAVRRTEARALGEREPVAARADDALLRSAAATSADVLIVPANAAEAVRQGTADSPAGGLGALLRWTHEPAASA
ncbi:Vms1/Ankzf1 family peptidyl-tRNA hydrolase [Streptomyces sp. Da 82-17]|uniref:baeRF2 domain-containing protein n=1 Tax=Streptomyces sp. Da 82-17 TaxID=3377116 RepID=UPI0038D4EE29